MQQAMTPQAHMQAPITPQQKSKRGMGKMQILMAISLISVAILAVLILFVMVFTGSNSVESAIKKDQYQAVFLNSQDGQVYFGKLEAYNGQFYKLTDIFYVRVEQKLQPEGQNQAAQQNISLAKLGNELHGPEDAMYISKDKVLFWENLKEEGQVVTAIREYKKNPSAADAKSSSTDAATTTQQSTETTNTTNTSTNR